ncbi:MAG: protease modulator HflK [Planctomycetota bacterium]|jgi:membrane protease subunit HflK
MAEQNNEDKKDLNPVPPELFAGEELDAASKSLSEALRISFVILKVIMIGLILAFLASGFEKVDSDEQAIVLRFGKIQREGEPLGPGAHWILPYPIDEIIKIPVERKVNLAINSFWYFQTQEDMLSEERSRVRPGMGLRPLLDGYCLIRSEDGAETAGSDGSDYNIVHTKWQLTYQIDDPERFFTSIDVNEVKPGDVYFNVITESVTPLLENMFEDAVVSAMVHYTIDEAISSRDRIPKHVERLLQEKLDEIESGIRVESVQLTRSEPPPHTRDAFEASIKASNTSQGEITKAKTDAETTLNEAGGPVAFALLKDKKSISELSEQQQELLWSDLGGTARERMADARAYQTRVVETAKANADYLQRLLPEYRQRPELVVQRIYLDAMEQIFTNADEIFVVQPAGGAKGTELRILLNRDPLLKPKKSGGQTTQTDQ